MADLVAPARHGGGTYSTDDPGEIARLRGHGYRLADEKIPTLADTQFHPKGQSVEKVLEHLQNHPEDAPRVIAEEKAGQARPTIVNAGGQ